MSEKLLDVAVLVTTLVALAGVAILSLAPLLFDAPPPGLAKARPFVLALTGAALALLVLEWFVVHRRSL